MFTPDPVEAFLGHAQGDDDVDVIPIVLVGRIFEGVGDLIPLSWIIIYQIGDFEDLTFGGFDELKPGFRISSLPFA